MVLGFNKNTIFFNMGLECIKNFNLNHNFNKNTIYQAGKYFSKSIELNQNIGESYFYLSYIFFIIDKESLSIKYLELAKKTFTNKENLLKLENLIYKFKNNKNSVPEKVKLNTLQVKDKFHLSNESKEIKSTFLDLNFAIQEIKNTNLEKTDSTPKYSALKVTTTLGEKLNEYIESKPKAEEIKTNLENESLENNNKIVNTNFEFNNEIKSKTSLGSKIMRVERIKL
ncbi:MAG: hypothetical protein U0457_10205 [Candidatus Sericytochromatia bacterium]